MYDKKRFYKHAAIILIKVFCVLGILCKDLYTQCGGWSRSGECESNPGWMLKNCMLSCNGAHCDKSIKKPDGHCANPLGLSDDGSGNFRIPDSAFSSGASHLAPGRKTIFYNK